MSEPPAGLPSPQEQMRGELARISANVTGVYGCLVATSDGFVIAHDIPDLEPTEIAAMVATTRALAARSTLAAGRGRFQEAIARGSLGYLAVYAAGDSAILAVIGTEDLNVGMLRFRASEFIARIAEHSGEFTRSASAGSAAPANAGPAGDLLAGSAHSSVRAPLPRRRRLNPPR